MLELKNIRFWESIKGDVSDLIYHYEDGMEWIQGSDRIVKHACELETKPFTVSFSALLQAFEGAKKGDLFSIEMTEQGACCRCKEKETILTQVEKRSMDVPAFADGFTVSAKMLRRIKEMKEAMRCKFALIEHLNDLHFMEGRIVMFHLSAIYSMNLPFHCDTLLRLQDEYSKWFDLIKEGQMTIQKQWLMLQDGQIQIALRLQEEQDPYFEHCLQQQMTFQGEQIADLHALHGKKEQKTLLSQAYKKAGSGNKYLVSVSFQDDTVWLEQQPIAKLSIDLNGQIHGYPFIGFLMENLALESGSDRIRWYHGEEYLDTLLGKEKAV